MNIHFKFSRSSKFPFGGFRGLLFLLSYLFACSSIASDTTFDFESGNLSGWNRLNTGGGIDITQEDKYAGNYAVKLTASSSSTDYWGVQLETPQITVVSRHLYKISFWARAGNGNGTIRLSTASSYQLKAEGGGEDRQYLPDLSISSEWTKYEYEVVYGANLEAVGNVLQLRIDAGKVSGKVYYIDNMTVEDLTPDKEGEGTAEGTTPFAKEHAKFLGNIIPNDVPANFDTYWNQVTPENSGKWGSVEYSRNNMNWSNLDKAYNHAKNKGYPFKYHTFVWGSQEPSWITSLSQSNQKAEMEEFMQAVANRYADIDYIDVVNEALHAPSNIREALGGSGTTGWDWIVWSFEKARQYFPNAKLHINDYGIISDPDKARNYIQIINILKERNLIDGIGIQCHEFNVNWASVSTMKTVLDLLGATGLPIHVSELDISGIPEGNEESQYQLYKEKFPVLWEHESVIGITLWGYITGSTWKEGTGIVEANGTERKAMTWLKSYMASDASKVSNKFGTTGINNTVYKKDDINVFPNPATDYITVKGNGVEKVDIYTASGTLIYSQMNDDVINIEQLERGLYLLKIKTEDNVVLKKILKK